MAVLLRRPSKIPPADREPLCSVQVGAWRLEIIHGDMAGTYGNLWCCGSKEICASTSSWRGLNHPMKKPDKNCGAHSAVRASCNFHALICCTEAIFHIFGAGSQVSQFSVKMCASEALRLCCSPMRIFAKMFACRTLTNWQDLPLTNAVTQGSPTKSCREIIVHRNICRQRLDVLKNLGLHYVSWVVVMSLDAKAI